jgi:hypothetical protein
MPRIRAGIEPIDEFRVGRRGGKPAGLLLGDPAVEAGGHDARALHVDHDAEHGRRVGGHAHKPAGASERLLRRVEFLEQAAAEKRFDRLRDGGRRESGGPREGGAGRRPVLLQHLHQPPLVDAPQERRFDAGIRTHHGVSPPLADLPAIVVSGSVVHGSPAAPR